MVTMQLEGLKPLLALFDKLPQKVVNKLVKPAMQSSGNLLKDRLASNARAQLRAAEGRGYRRKSGVHLSTTPVTRAKIYRKGGDTVFVAVGFGYREGGYHGHLVELGHQIVKGGTLGNASTARMTAAGERFLKKSGWEKGDWTRGTTKRGKPKKLKGSFAKNGLVMKGMEFPMRLGKTRIRGGGKISGSRTRDFPMLGPAFQTMNRAMVINIENELKKIGPEAARIAAELGARK